MKTSHHLETTEVEALRNDIARLLIAQDRAEGEINNLRTILRTLEAENRELQAVYRSWMAQRFPRKEAKR